MTHQEKATELVKKFENIKVKHASHLPETGLTELESIQCALICVNEIINTNALWHKKTLDLDIIRNAKKHLSITCEYDYWQQVKQEIEKL